MSQAFSLLLPLCASAVTALGIACLAGCEQRSQQKAAVGPRQVASTGTLKSADSGAASLADGQTGSGQSQGESVDQLVLAAQQHFQQAELLAAEQSLRRALQVDQQHVMANRGMAAVLNTEGRRWEAEPYLFRLVRQGEFTLEELILLGNLDEPYDNALVREEALRVQDDPLPMIGTARIKLLRNQNKDALEALQAVLEKYPQQPEAQALMGRALLELQDDQKLLAWAQALPEPAYDHPETWYVLGVWAEQHQQIEAAIRCFWEGAVRDANHRRCLYQLGVLLQRQKAGDTASPFLERAHRLSALGNLLYPIFFQGPDVPRMQQIAEQMEALGRLWEAWAWHIAVLSQDPQDEQSRQGRDRLHRLLQQQRSPRTLRSTNPALAIDLSGYPLPDWKVVPPQNVSSPDGPLLTWIDRAAQAGIDFEFFDSSKPETGIRIFESTGGGVAVIDYDADGWPDLYFTQASQWPPDPNQKEYLDRLYRNLGNGRFMDVTEAAGLGDQNYSQGAAVGDINNDGFPDLYVANIGVNRLYLNNGDGGFSEVTQRAGLHSAVWTTSCLIADLNGDGAADLYDVNYLGGEHDFAQVCAQHTGRHCGPSLFPAEQDRLYLNLQEGTFEDGTAASGLEGQLGKGLGIVAADFHNSGRLSIFVANDGMANHLYVNSATQPGAMPQYTEQALMAGLAFDRDGRDQASMGVAIGDPNLDGRLDLFVTNYYNESNTYYDQQPGNLFLDQTRAAGLREHSFLMLGFGSQFIDGELDGLPDLVLTNGHVDDLRDQGQPFEMRPQYYRNLGQARFQELRSQLHGYYFQGVYRGRGLALIDWNRDGREDFAVSNMAAPASLVTNETEQAGHYLAVELRGVHSSRDAVGAKVMVTADGQAYHRQLIGGDGYQASNQRQLIFGLGPAEQLQSLEVQWPSGLLQRFDQLETNQRVLLIEGRQQPILLPQASGVNG